MNIESIHWHDSQIRKVIEIPGAEQLIFEVDYPVDWKQNQFEPHSISFDKVCAYEIHEGPIAGAPTILDALLLEVDSHAVYTLRIDTNAGHRIVRCMQVTLSKGTS